MEQEQLNQLTQRLGENLVQRGWVLVTAESCTGGAIAAQATEIAGSSEWFHGAFVVYTNEWKHQFLQVPSETLQQHGAVSAETVTALLQGIFAKTEAQLAIAVSGIAGPGGGSPEKPVGTVYIGVALRPGLPSPLPTGMIVQRHQFAGNRSQIRRSTTETALTTALKIVTGNI